jgi:transposase
MRRLSRIVGPKHRDALGQATSSSWTISAATKGARSVRPFAPPGAKLFFLPKYSPDLKPIDQVFAKLKHLLRRLAARSFDAITAAIGTLLDTFTPQECANYFANSGYART